MPISPAFYEHEMPSPTQRCYLILLGIFFPPLPIYLLTGPNYTMKTKEMLVSCLLTILFPTAGVIYSIYFILYIFPNARREAGAVGYIRVNDIEDQVMDPADSPRNDQVVASTPQAETLLPKSNNDTTHEQTKGPQTDDSVPPPYEEFEGSSNGAVARAEDMHKFGDHKVQS